MKRILISLVFGISLTLSLCVYASCVQSDISKNVIRLHIKANSNSLADQKIKLAVRDKVVAFLSPALKNSKSILQSQYIIEENLSEIEKLANDCLKEYNTNYLAKANLLQKDFPTKSYKNITLPAGKYLSLCIDLGSSDGENWWCVMFPPLCLNDSTLYLPEDSEKYLKQNLNSDSFAIIKTNDENFTTVYRFKIFDYISSILN